MEQTEEFFPECDIRLVAVSDSVDSDKGENEMTPIKHMFNEWYSRDISKKCRISSRVKGNAGISLGPSPYGYMGNPQNPKSWVIDVEAAEIVARYTGWHWMDGVQSKSLPRWMRRMCSRPCITGAARGCHEAASTILTSRIIGKPNH